MRNKGELRLTVGDILNPAYTTYENRDSKKTYNSDTDKIFSSYKPGINITVGFNYNLGL